MDWMKIINAHVMWKKRLADYAKQDQHSEHLDANLICQDNQCDFGRWLYSTEGKLWQNEAIYIQVRELHADFHHKAAEIVQLIDNNQIEQACTLLRGDYSKTSEQLKHRTLQLYSHTQA